MKRLGLIAAVVTLAGCYMPPTSTAPTRAATEVNASVGRTWDAVIDGFAERNIPIATMERVSGFIATQALTVGAGGTEWADCGSGMGVPLGPDQATYNVRVLGDSTHSTVRVTVRWTQGGHVPADPLVECPTKGAWEAAFETAVKGRAEGTVAAGR